MLRVRGERWRGVGNVLCGVLDVAEVDGLEAQGEGEEGEEREGGEMHADGVRWWYMLCNMSDG